ncbi:MAG TPA: hypothetical protein VD948_02795 [Rhodothermales bacterium]|nr:hypothetical protein [Rhodothermales bacterium]
MAMFKPRAPTTMRGLQAAKANRPMTPYMSAGAEQGVRSRLSGGDSFSPAGPQRIQPPSTDTTPTGTRFGAIAPTQAPRPEGLLSSGNQTSSRDAISTRGEGDRFGLSPQSAETRYSVWSNRPGWRETPLNTTVNYAQPVPANLFSSVGPEPVFSSGTQTETLGRYPAGIEYGESRRELGADDTYSGKLARARAEALRFRPFSGASGGGEDSAGEADAADLPEAEIVSNRQLPPMPPAEEPPPPTPFEAPPPTGEQSQAISISPGGIIGWIAGGGPIGGPIAAAGGWAGDKIQKAIQGGGEEPAPQQESAEEIYRRIKAMTEADRQEALRQIDEHIAAMDRNVPQMSQETMDQRINTQRARMAHKQQRAGAFQQAMLANQGASPEAIAGAVGDTFLTGSLESEAQAAQLQYQMEAQNLEAQMVAWQQKAAALRMKAAFFSQGYERERDLAASLEAQKMAHMFQERLARMQADAADEITFKDVVGAFSGAAQRAVPFLFAGGAGGAAAGSRPYPASYLHDW